MVTVIKRWGKEITEICLIEFIFCEGYSGIRIRSDDPYIRNVASGGAQYIIVWLYAELRT